MRLVSIVDKQYMLFLCGWYISDSGSPVVSPMGERESVSSESDISTSDHTGMFSVDGWDLNVFN